MTVFVFSRKLVPELDGRKVNVESVPRIGEKMEFGESRVEVLDVHHLIHDFYQGHHHETYLGSVNVVRVFTE